MAENMTENETQIIGEIWGAKNFHYLVLSFNLENSVYIINFFFSDVYQVI